MGCFEDHVYGSKQSEDLGDTVDESYVVKKLLRAVPAKFLQIASTLEQFADLDEMTVEEVIGRLKAHEERMKRHGDTEERKLLLTHQEWTERNKKKGEGSSKSAPKGNHGGCSRGRGRGRGRGGPSGGRGGRGRGGSHQQKERSHNGGHSQDKSNIQCYNCQEFGHYAAECTNPRKERNHENNLIQEDNEPALLLSSLEAKEEAGKVLLNEEKVNPKLRSNGDVAADPHMWYLDTGASNHMTGDRGKFQELDTTVQGTELCSNIISLGQLDERGDEIRINKNVLRIYDSNMRLLMKVQRSSNRLYKIELREVSSRCLVGEIKDSTWLWHTRLGHVNFTALKSMVDKGIIEGVPKMVMPSEPCEGCLVGKQSRKPYPSSTNFRAQKRLELIHGDLCGPVTPPTPAGNRYFMLLVDDYSRVMWVYLTVLTTAERGGGEA